MQPLLSDKGNYAGDQVSIVAVAAKKLKFKFKFQL